MAVPPNLRVLVAHDAREAQDEVDSAVAFLQTRFASSGNVTVATARDERERRLGAAGSEEQLALDLGAGRGMNGQPLFHLIVCLRERVGRNTAALVRAALQTRKKVVFMHGAAFVPVAQIRCEDAENWARGWLLLAPEGVGNESR